MKTIEMATFALVMTLACGCANSLGDPPPLSDAGNTNDAGAIVPDGGDPFCDGSSDATAGPGCATESRLVYVVDVNRNLYSFDPQTLQFKPAGKIDCTNSSLYSMAVDRSANAWILTQSGTMVRYDIRAQSCTPLSFVTAQHGFIEFGMGFASNSKGSSAETLYLGSSNALGLATLDTSTLTVTPVAKFDQLGGRVELTGTGDGELYGLFEATPYVIGGIEKATAKILTQAPQPQTAALNFAFAFWGGDFYTFVGSDVSRYRPSDKSTVALTKASFEIVGAGVSTCAPTLPPN
ncbi:hypothetical protein BH09MYX1_BH09MYX1_57930 [soil metagenome]